MRETVNVTKGGVYVRGIRYHYTRIVGLKGWELAITRPDRGGTKRKCEACGSRREVAFRGWVDEDSPMLTCIDCGKPSGVDG